jgi:hypothetical protein
VHALLISIRRAARSEARSRSRAARPCLRSSSSSPAAAHSPLPLAALILAGFTQSAPPQITSRDPVSTIIRAYRTHTIVALNDDHGEERCAAFRLSLIRDPRFFQTVNDIVVEFGNSRSQAVIDAFVAGEPVSKEALRAVWQDTTIPRPVWDRPIYEEFFRAVRAVNEGRRRDQQLRVLLGDPPIDWDEVRTAEDLRGRVAGRSIFPADLIVREVIDKQRRALVIYGGLHLMRQNLQGENLIERVDKYAPKKTFVVVSHPLGNLAAVGIDSKSLKPPALALTTGSSLVDQIDAILYLGAPSNRRTSHLTPALCGDLAYRAMRISRMALAGDGDARQHFDIECTSDK